MYQIVRSSSFKRDMKNYIYNTKVIDRLKEISMCLLSESLIPEYYQDHPLKGKFS